MSSSDKQYPPGTQEKYNSFQSRIPVMEDGVKTEITAERRGEGEGEGKGSRIREADSDDREVPPFIIRMSSAKSSLLCIPERERDPEYSNILKLIDEYLLRNCAHELVKDFIDLDPDTSKTITYCSKCYLTFN